MISYLKARLLSAWQPWAVLHQLALNILMVARSYNGHRATLDFQRNRLVVWSNDDLCRFLLGRCAEIRRFCRVGHLVIIKGMLLVRLHNLDLSCSHSVIHGVLGRRYYFHRQPSGLPHLFLWCQSQLFLLEILRFSHPIGGLWRIVVLPLFWGWLQFRPVVQPLHVSSLNAMTFPSHCLTLMPYLILLNFRQDRLSLLGEAKDSRANGLDIFVIWHHHDPSWRWLPFVLI